MPILETIKSRGYWRVHLTPTVFQPDRIKKLGDLETAVRECQVELTGWPYPYFRYGETSRHADYIEASIDWQHYKEVWRLYQSGQFIHLFGMPEDWYAESELAAQLRVLRPGTVLDFHYVLYTLTEFLLFCGRLSQRLGLGPVITIDYKLVGVGGRELQTLTGLAIPLFGRRSAAELTDYGNSLMLDQADLLARSNEIAVDQALAIYDRFGWEPARANVIEDQRRFLERRL